MTDLSTLTDTELTERIAIALGLKRDEGGLWERPDLPNFFGTIPAFTDSIDALKAGPEKLLREVGWKIAVCELPDGRFEAMWEWNFDDSKRVIAIAPTEARARAEAVCQGLEVSK